MSSSRERKRRGASRSRRTPDASSSGGGGPSIPTIPVIIGAGVILVVALIAFLIWQSGKEPGSQFDDAAEIESREDPELPGEHVALPEIYQDERGLALYGSDGSVPNTAPHVTTDVDYVGDGNSNPPAGGPHWAGGCPRDPEEAGRCGPAPWGIYREPWAPQTLVHNMEHGGMIVWYNTTDQEIIDDLESFVQDLFPVVLTPYPDMEDETIAVTTWGRIDKFPVSEYTQDRLREFEEVHNCRFNPEDLPDC